MEDVMKKYVIEREIPKIGTLKPQQLREAATKSNQALRELGPDIQWQESFVAADKRSVSIWRNTRQSSVGTRN
jgi:hypothetical protein